MCVCLRFESTPVDSYNLSSHYRSLALRGAPRLGVVVTLVSISKIIWKAEIFNTGMSILIHHSDCINIKKKGSI